jgi:starvation-inducible outer membrane lipoprotein
VKTVFATGICMMLAACVSDPAQVSRDTYMIAIGARDGSEAVQKASNFCRAKGRVMQLRSSGVPGWTLQSDQMIFVCLLADNPL